MRTEGEREREREREEEREREKLMSCVVCFKKETDGAHALQLPQVSAFFSSYCVSSF
jgi:hypothetical protein